MIMPGSSGKLLDLLAVAPEQRGFEHLGEAHRLVADTPLPAPTGVFPRYIEDKKEQA